jgi:endonuclease-3
MEYNRKTSQKNIKTIIKLLRNKYSHRKLALRFRNPLELLVSTILSAQCTDERVNRVTKDLFRKYKNVNDYAKANIKKFEDDIKSTGFYRNKARNIISASRQIIERFNGKIPQTMEELITLPGVGRKTANIILTFAFRKIKGIVVDTHVMRLSQRLGLSKNSNADKIERDLMKVISKRYWKEFSCLLMEHGREICFAKRPFCERCILKQICPSFDFFTKHRSI